MAIIVENKTDRFKYLLLGAGLGIYKSARESVFGGNLFPFEEEGSVKSIAVCNEEGEILFFESDVLKVIEIDGVKISDIKEIKKNENENKEKEHYTCPGCENKIDEKDCECPHCGLRLK